MSDESRHVQAPDAVFQTIDGRAVVILPHEQSVHLLNEVGSFIWDHLERPHSRDEVIAAVVEAFDVERAVAAADAGAFIDEMLERRMVVST